jgi:hypothetical protein
MKRQEYYLVYTVSYWYGTKVNETTPMTLARARCEAKRLAASGYAFTVSIRKCFDSSFAEVIL